MELFRGSRSVFEVVAILANGIAGKPISLPIAPRWGTKLGHPSTYASALSAVPNHGSISQPSSAKPSSSSSRRLEAATPLPPKLLGSTIVSHRTLVMLVSPHHLSQVLSSLLPPSPSPPSVSCAPCCVLHAVSRQPCPYLSPVR